MRGWAPGRVNIIGEHTDYNGGLVLPMAIHLGVTATVRPRTDDRLIFSSAQAPDDVVSLPLGALAPGACSGWAAYVAGAIWALAEQTTITQGLEVAIDGTVPLGAGLSSSAAVECSVLVAVCAELGIALAPRELARLAQRAENDFVGVPTGSMDQVASMLGRAGHALRYDVRSDTVEQVPVDLSSADAEFLIIDTRARHALVDGGYADRRATCERAAALLEVKTLAEIRDLDRAAQQLSGDPDAPRLTARTRHVVTEIQRVDDAVDALRTADLTRLGELMCASHASLRDDYAVSCAELDVAVEAALAAGALGARMMGGGFGGSAIVLAPVRLREQITAEVTVRYEAQGFDSPAVIAVSASDGAHIIG